MIYISHRGNLNGTNSDMENKPSYILNALKKNFDVEVDVWLNKNKFYLGHDGPRYLVENKFFKQKRLWLHAKNIEAFSELLKMNINCFWHQNDDVTLTSNGFIWTYPGKKLTKNSICVLPELNEITKFNCAGVCSDYISDYYNEQS